MGDGTFRGYGYRQTGIDTVHGEDAVSNLDTAQPVAVATTQGHQTTESTTTFFFTSFIPFFSLFMSGPGQAPAAAPAGLSPSGP